MPTAIAKKVITFSLVSIPVSVHPATSQHRVPLHMVHDRGGGRLRYRRVCKLDGQELAEGEIARGVEMPDGGTLVLSRQDLEQLPTPDTKEIRVLGFLNESRVDPLHYDNPVAMSARSGQLALKVVQ
ncbi:hypothetical protein BKI49_12195 [Streptomyces sp. Tue6028]|uniref:Ku protein n=1 Tax=Streptomyces sp. Tue6028 TaxID=2036037 RepID=UPI000BD3D1E3|nr:Ku protein [Streptomyces sp. Tue6028]PBC63878.1 hypothetical protein BKI49_12195 [Streptomyces sp. Tue6028]